jgi:DNA-binding NarL/FixJ family response regulator
MRFVICDDDEVVAQVLDAALTMEGHQLVGVAETTEAAVDLVGQYKPDVAVIEPAVGCNPVFDAVDVAIKVGTGVVLFSRSGVPIDHGRYVPEPTMVPKPNITALETVIGDMLVARFVDRRRAPTRRFQTTGPSDAAAFYAAINEAVEGDAFVSVAPRFDVADEWLWRVTAGVRETDLVLASSTAVMVFMPGAGEEGVHKLHERLIGDAAESNEGEMRAVVLDAGESPTDAFTRLKDAAL